MSQELVISSARHEAALQRLMSTSKRTAAEVMKQEARLVFTEVAKVTPPSHGKVTGRQAEKHAKTKIAAEIHSLYGTAGDAYDLIAQKSAATAGAFWFLHSSDETAAANGILREATGSILYPFDGGAHHRRNFRRRGRSFRYFVTDPEALNDYVTQQQERVWWLASGWSDALQALGVRLPYGVDRHSASPGTLRIQATSQRIVITMLNEVSYASEVDDIRRRIRWAMDVRADRMQLNWDNYLSRLARESGMKAK